MFCHNLDLEFLNFIVVMVLFAYSITIVLP